MKRTLLIIVCLVILLSVNLYAQKGKEIILGAGTAFTSTWIINQNFYGEPECDYAPKYGYALNLNFGYNFTEHIALMAEFQYSQQGQKYKDKQSWDGNVFPIVERDITLKYFNFPLLFKYMFGTRSTQFRVLAGPQLGILWDAEQEYLRTDVAGSNDLRRISTYVDDLDGNSFDVSAPDINDRIMPIDIGAVLDIGADFSPSKVFFISAGLRFNYGFTDINAEPYRLVNYKGESYELSNNVYGGFYISFNFRVDVEGYNQRSF